jgi:hypothetical protein
MLFLTCLCAGAEQPWAQLLCQPPAPAAPEPELLPRCDSMWPGQFLAERQQQLASFGPELLCWGVPCRGAGSAGRRVEHHAQTR